jgi:hypothetical protein
MMILGGRKHKNELGEDVSYRHYKAEVLKHFAELVELSEVEVEWEDQLPDESHDLTLEHVRLRKQYNAVDALHRYKSVLNKGLIGLLERHDASFSRKRGREWEIASDPTYPESGIDEDMRWSIPSQEQLDALKNSTIPEAKETDIPDAPPSKRQRRREVTVSFHDNVYVCTDADVDVLRKTPLPLPKDTFEPATVKPGPSILRTTPLESYPGPKRSHTIVSLHANDGNLGRSMASYSRRHKRYTPGRWAKSGDQEIVDTSGWTIKDDVQYVLNMFELQAEAAAMDNEPRPKPKMYHNGVEGTLMFMGNDCFWTRSPADKPT